MIFAGAVVSGVVVGLIFYARYHRVKPVPPAAIAGGSLLALLLIGHFVLEDAIVVRDVADMGEAVAISLLVNLALIGGGGAAAFFITKSWIKKNSRREVAPKPEPAAAAPPSEAQPETEPEPEPEPAPPTVEEPETASSTPDEPVDTAAPSGAPEVPDPKAVTEDQIKEVGGVETIPWDCAKCGAPGHLAVLRYDGFASIGKDEFTDKSLSLALACVSCKAVSHGACCELIMMGSTPLFICPLCGKGLKTLQIPLRNKQA